MVALFVHRLLGCKLKVLLAVIGTLDVLLALNLAVGVDEVVGEDNMGSLDVLLWRTDVQVFIR